jgi:hypothetical protein
MQHFVFINFIYLLEKRTKKEHGRLTSSYSCLKPPPPPKDKGFDIRLYASVVFSFPWHSVLSSVHSGNPLNFC